jgi:general secretion pathway protein G
MLTGDSAQNPSMHYGDVTSRTENRGKTARTVNKHVPSNMNRTFVFLLIVTVVSVVCGCSPKQQLQDEESLREALVLLRGEISQFTLDHQRGPVSFGELVSSGYMKQIPTDPFTGRNDTWRIEKSAEDFEVHSGSDAMSSGGTRYGSW